MYYLTSDVIKQANDNIKKLDAKVGGLLCILSCLDEIIEENKSYTIDGRILRKQLRFVFDKVFESPSDNAKPSYIIFAVNWYDTFFKKYIKEKIDLLSCAVFFLRRHTFERELTNKELIDTFVKEYHLEKLKDHWFLEKNGLQLEYNQSDVEENQREFYKKMGYSRDFRSLLFNGVIQKSAADLKAAGQIQTLYSGSGIQSCFLLSDEQLDRYYIMSNTIQNTRLNKNDFSREVLTPEWFNKNGKAFKYMDEEALKEREAFLKKYNTDILKNLEGMMLLRKIFLNGNNNDNLCYELEFNKKLVELFGSIRGVAYKYGLFYSPENQSWVTGSSKKPQFLTSEEAIAVGTEIRDYLIAGADVLNKYEGIEKLDDYRNLFEELNEATGGYGNRIWFLKYYQMLAPDLFPPIYSEKAQEIVLNAIGEIPDDNPIVRMGQVQQFIKKCEVSPVVFSKTFWSIYNPNNVEIEGETEEITDSIKYETKYDSSFSRNRILFGAPGTGKSFTLNKEAKSLIVQENNANYERVTFHPDYSYANFVGSYKPVPTIDSDGSNAITYVYVPGPFMRVYVNALRNSGTGNITPFLLIIEEINRANVAAVFGDIFQLLDRGDNFVSEYPIQASEDVKKYLAKELGGVPNDYTEIKLPDNLFIWATMNSADQGVFPMDTAFKRRWDFTYIGINENEVGIVDYDFTLGVGEYKRTVNWNELRKAINNKLSEFNINEDKLLGPYFISKSILDSKDSSKFIKTFKNKVLMYLFDDAAKHRRAQLFEKVTNPNIYSTVCTEFEEKGVFIFLDAISEKFTTIPSVDSEESRDKDTDNVGG